jgi:hypothetical protein
MSDKKRNTFFNFFYSLAKNIRLITRAPTPPPAGDQTTVFSTGKKSVKFFIEQIVISSQFVYTF